MNGVLQGRAETLQLDLIRMKENFAECDRSFQCQEHEQSLVDEEDIWEQRNRFYQKQAVRETQSRKYDHLETCSMRF